MASLLWLDERSASPAPLYSSSLSHGTPPFGRLISALNKDFKAFIAPLNDNQVRYLVVGGYAVAFHGHPRYTRDKDIWIELTPENPRQAVKALLIGMGIDIYGWVQ